MYSTVFPLAFPLSAIMLISHKKKIQALDGLSQIYCGISTFLMLNIGKKYCKKKLKPKDGGRIETKQGFQTRMLACCFCPF